MCSIEEDTQAAGPVGQSSAQAASAPSWNESPKDVVEQLLRAKPPRECWLAFAKLIRAKYAYSIMHEVHVVCGGIVGCQDVQWSLALPQNEAAPAAKPQFDAHWQAFESFCAKLGTAHLAEVIFFDGHPVTVRVTEGKKRFQCFLRRAYAQEEAKI
jgi:hypothetical protein